MASEKSHLCFCHPLRFPTREFTIVVNMLLVQLACHIGHKYARALLILTALRADAWGLECRKFSQLLLDESLLLHFLQGVKQKYYAFTVGLGVCKWLESTTLEKPHLC